jgi:Flp pilus assembly protein TadG
LRRTPLLLCNLPLILANISYFCRFFGAQVSGVVLALLKQLINDRSGQFAIVASIVSIPLLLAVGLSIDYVNISRVKSELQQSIDIAALAIAREGDGVTQAQAEAIAARFLQENFLFPHSAPTVVLSGTKVIVRSNVSVPINFGGLFGTPTADISADATTAISYANYEIALALDTTGSMAGGKLAAMKDAVNGLIDTMEAQNSRADSLKFSVVPFSSKVNVGAQHGPAYSPLGAVTRQPADWLDARAQSPINQNDLDPGVSRFVMMKQLRTDWEGCVESRHSTAANPYDVNDAPPNPADPATLFVPAFASDEPDSGPYPNSYIADGSFAIGAGTPPQRMGRYGASYAPAFKAQPFSAQVVDAAAWTPVPTDFSNQTYYGSYPVPKGPNFGCDVQPILPLTTNFNAVRAKVNSLQALGSTNILEGAVWGWKTLTSRPPFTEGRPGNSVGTRKIMVLLTDGTNNLGPISNSLGSSHSSYGYFVDGRLGISSGSASAVTDAMNAKTLAACENAKADKIEIYTIRLEEPNVTTGNMLRDCATDADHYIDVPNRALLDEAFEKIKEKIALVRLSS